MKIEKILLPLISIIAIVILEGIALLTHTDGALLAGSMALIAGLGGYTIGRKRRS